MRTAGNTFTVMSEIARHRLAEGSHQRLSDPSHYQGLKPQTVRSTRCEAQQITPLAPPFVPATPSVEVRSLHEYDQLLVVAP